MDAVVSAAGLTVAFRRPFRRETVTALRQVDLAVDRGTILGVLGPNGSGKTTLLRVFAALQRPTAGSARICGEPPESPAARNRVAFQPEGPLPMPWLSAPEFLAWIGGLARRPARLARAAASMWLERLDLLHAGNRPVRTFSTGMQRRLGLAAVLLTEPEVLLLDEPTSGLDPLGSEAVMRILQEQAAAGTTIVLASHHLQEVEQICHRVAVLHRGRLVAQGTLDELLGTGERSLVVRGLDEARIAEIDAAIRRLGGEVVRSGAHRQHLFALFRRLSSTHPDRDPAP